MADRTPGYIDGRRIRVGNVSTWSDVPNVLTPGSMEAYGIYEDFPTVEQLNIGGNSNGWDFWIQNAAVLSHQDVAGGVALITCGGANEDSGQITLGSLAGGGIFFPAADKHIWFEARVYAGIVAAGEFNYFVGLINPVNAAILTDGGGAGAMPNQDILGFFSWDGGTDNWYSVGDNATAQSVVDLGTAVTAAWHTLGFYVNGVTSVQCYIDRVATGAIIAPANIPVTGLMPAIAVKAGAVAAETFAVDYVMCVQLR